MQLQDRKVKTAAVLRQGQMDAILVHVLPLQRQRFRPTQPGEEEQFKKYLVDGIVEIIHIAVPCFQIFDDRPVGFLFIPLDRHCRRFRQIVGSAGMVPDGAKYLQRVIGRRRCCGHQSMPLHHHRLGDFVERQAQPVLEVPLELLPDAKLVCLRAELWSRKIGIHGDRKCRSADLDILAGPSTPMQGKTKSRLSGRIRRNHGKTPDQNSARLTADILLEIPGLRLLADKENKAPDLAVPVLGGPLFGLWNLASEGFCELWHFVSFL